MEKAIRIITVIGILLLFMMLVPAAQAQTALPLDRARSGTIVGNSGGAFDRYTLNHPGAGQPITLRMTFSPWHPNHEKGIGFKLYGARGKLIGESVKVEGHPTELALTVTADFPTEYLVQVQNYYSGFPMRYSIPEGLAAAEARVGPPAPAGSAQRPGRLVRLAQGTLAGLRHGSFDFYKYQHPGGKPIWIKMIYQPDHWIIAPGVGFNVYRGADRVAEGQPLGLDQHIRWAKLEPDKPTLYLIQVYNYIPEIQLTYQLATTERKVSP